MRLKHLAWVCLAGFLLVVMAAKCFPPSDAKDLAVVGCGTVQFAIGLANFFGASRGSRKGFSKEEWFPQLQLALSGWAFILALWLA